MNTRRSARKNVFPEPREHAKNTNCPKKGEKKRASPIVATKPVKKIKLSTINFNHKQTDQVVDHLKNLSNNQPSIRSSQNISAEILDQIALEGLTGITLGKLFHLLDALFPSLDCVGNENCQQYVWSILVNRYIPSKAVQAFFVDPNKEKDDETNISPTKGVIIEKKIQLPTNKDKRYPKIDSLLHPVQEGFIMGSCARYLSRVEISQELQNSSDDEDTLKSMYSTNQKYGFENIFFVANQFIRSKAILPDWADPNVDIKLREYCALELIGRSRIMGTIFPNDKALGRYRIMLVAKGFITQYQKSCTSPVEHHLVRFSSNEVLASNKASASAAALASAAAAGASARGDSSDEEDGTNKSLSSICCDFYKLKSDRSTLSMVYDVIAESKGITKLELRKRLKIPKFHLRNHLKNLLSIRMICSTLPKDSESQFRIYRTVHKSNKRRKVKEEVVKPTGVMSTWDEADLQAKKMIGHKRSTFSQAEDSLLILCRISSILIDPSLQVSWCVNKRLIRDLLHGELVESQDKTSDACLRRVKYLKKLPNNIMSINELTAELRDDPDIRKLTGRFKRPYTSDDKLNKLFVQVLKSVRLKIPNLLGITTMASSIVACPTTKTIASVGSTTSFLKRVSNNDGTSAIARSGHNNSNNEKSIEINDHGELNRKYELVDCQSVASILRGPTYEKAKNVVDVKFNNASLVTMAFTLTSCLSAGMSNNLLQTNWRAETEGEQQVATSKRRAQQWLLGKFYSGYHDKLVSSVLSKLNKRSLLTRKCPAEQASMYKPKTKMSLKLNQSVIFLLTRHQASSLMQLTHPINKMYRVELSESNEMASIALLTSLCSMGSFNLDLRLKIPTNVVGIDQGNENFKTLCEKASEGTKEILAKFMSRCGGSLNLTATDKAASHQGERDESEVRLAESASSNFSERPTNHGKGSIRDVNKSSQVESKPPTRTDSATNLAGGVSTSNNKMDDSRRALFLLRHELKSHALDKCGNLSDCLIVQPCNIKFFSAEDIKLSEEALEEFLDQAKPSDLIDEEQQQQEHFPTSWIVESFRLPQDKDLTSDKDFETNKIPVQYQARLWKQIDGSAHMLTLFKLIESLLSWIIVYPGIERDLLEREFGHLMPSEHLFELLELMDNLKLIATTELEQRDEKPRLFGFTSRGSNSRGRSITYEAKANAFINYSQLLNRYITRGNG